MTIRETIGKKLALLAGYDIDGLVADGNHFAARCRELVRRRDRLVRDKFRLTLESRRHAAERDEWKAFAVRCFEAEEEQMRQRDEARDWARRMKAQRDEWRDAAVKQATKETPEHRCENCFWWDNFGPPKDAGRCMVTATIDGVKRESGTRAWALSHDFARCYLYTAPDFSCVQWRAKVGVPDDNV